MRTLLLALGLLLAPVMTAGAVSSDECRPLRDRQLNGHTFQLPILQQSALVTTHVGLREGLARYDVPDVPFGENGRRDVLLVGVQQTLDLGLRLTDWLALSGFARGTIVLGTDAPSLVAQGGTLDLVGQAGLVVRLLRNDTSGTQISLRASGGIDRGKDLTLLPFARAIVDDPLPTLEDVVTGEVAQYLLEPSSEKIANGGVYLAQALGQSFSLQASGAAEYAWQKRTPFNTLAGARLEQTTYAVRVTLAAALTADLHPRLGIPIAVMGEYLFLTGRQTSVLFPDRTLNSSTLALGVYYSGRPHLQLGVGAVTTLKAEPRRGLGPRGMTQESGEPTLSYGQFILRYIF
ncbi:MAG: hypothetical protein EOO71_31240 [Myxococcaceae bacterium]|nr:MAG: hypothetical protein EOO71_31240 [Myxococcaceae bacterium]